MSDNQGTGLMHHLEELRWRLVRIVVAILLVAIVIWVYQEWIMVHLFLSMKGQDFITFRLLCTYFQVCVGEIPVKMQSMTVSGQFNYAMMMSLIGGIIVTFPFIFYQIWAFVRPGLKPKEIKVVKGLVVYVSLLFFLGISFGYFVVAPLTVQFFGSFQISNQIENNFTVGSYMGTILSTVFYSGLLFLLPVVSYALTKIGLIGPEFLKKYRRHAIVVILIISAIITPPDILSQVIVAIPIILLYEIGILVSTRVNRNKNIESKT